MNTITALATAVRNYEVPRIIDNTMMSTLRDCQMMHRWAFLEHLHLGSAISVDLHAGACFAKARATIYEQLYLKAKPLDVAMAAGRFAFDREWGNFVIPANKKTNKTQEHTWRAVESYVEQYGPPNDVLVPWSLEGLNPFEFSFSVPLDEANTGIAGFVQHPDGFPFIYTGKFDAFGHHTGLPVILDDKTTSSLGGMWSQKWNLRSQFMGYLWALRALQSWGRVSTVVVRGVAILKDTITHQEVVKQYPQFLIDVWLQQLDRDLRKMIHGIETGEFNVNFSTACTNYGGCDFMMLCENLNDPKGWVDVNYAKRIWNPLGVEEQNA